MLDILDFKQIAAATLALLRRSRMGSPGESTSLWRGGQTVTTGFLAYLLSLLKRREDVITGKSEASKLS